MIDAARAFPDGRREALRQEIASLGDRCAILRHPFYERWSAGELSREELRAYASEYDHAALAHVTVSRTVDRLTREIARSPIGCAVPGQDQVTLWRGFAKDSGWRGGSAWFYAEEPLSQTTACVSTWIGAGDRSAALDIVTLHAIESLRAHTAPVELGGLLDHYGFRHGAGTEYFRRVLGQADDRLPLAHAIVDKLLGWEDTSALIGQAELVYRAYLGLLDGLEEMRAWTGGRLSCPSS